MFQGGFPVPAGLAQVPCAVFPPSTGWSFVLDGQHYLSSGPGLAGPDYQSVTPHSQAVSPVYGTRGKSPREVSPFQCYMEQVPPPQPPLQPPNYPRPLEPWEETALQISRNLRNYRAKQDNSAPSRTAVAGMTTTAQHSLANPPEKENKEAAALPSLPLLATAFMPPPALLFPTSQTLSFQNPSAPLKPQANSRVSPPAATVATQPQLLEYFLKVGYPLQMPPAASARQRSDDSGDSEGSFRQSWAYRVALTAAHEQMVRWFYQGRDLHRCRSAAHRQQPAGTFALSLFPHVAQRMVVAHAMSPRTAAAWLVRVFVGLLTTESDRLRCEGVQLGLSVGTVAPSWPLPTSCLEHIRHYAEAVRDAVYQLQDNQLPPVELDDRLRQQQRQHCTGFGIEGAAKHDSHDGGGLGGWDGDQARGHTGVAGGLADLMLSAKNEDEMPFLYLMVLQQVTERLLCGCLGIKDPTAQDSDAHGDSTEESAAEARAAAATQQQQTKRNLPHALTADSSSAPLSYVVLEGLMRLAFLLRIRFDYYAPARSYYRTDAEGTRVKFTPEYAQGSVLPPWPELASEVRVLHPVEKQWMAYKHSAAARIDGLAYQYYRFVPLLDCVLSLQ